MLRLDRVSKIYPQGEVLKDVTWELNPNERIGLVGANGAGKTTQFRIISGQTEPSTGTVIRKNGLKVAYLTQEFAVDPNNTVREEFSTVFHELHEVKKALHAVHIALETATPEDLDKLLKKMDRLQHEYEGKGGYHIDVVIDKILPDIGFEQSDAERLVGEFSGGWQMRMNLGKIMIQEPDVLLLDEPTNHLDLETIEWFEEYMKKQNIAMVVVSHDRELLDKLCTKIVETEYGVATTYSGSYTKYVEAKALNREAQIAAYERQQAELEKQQVFIDRFRASATRSTQAKSREKQLDKIELIESPEAELRTLEFKFPPALRSGKDVLSIKDLTHAYGDHVVFLGANLHVERGDKIALLGPNGAGKSTLLRLIMQTEKPDDGVVALGEHNIKVAYFAQNQADALDLNRSALEIIADETPKWKDSEIRGLLGKFLFSGDDVFKKVRDLSGGEKARLALAKLLTGTANVLILDEPTNHLDIASKEAVEKALKAFEGTIIVVSHDRYFISQIANKIVELRDGGLKQYHGDYTYYKERIAVERQREQELKETKEREAQAAAKRAKQREKDKLKEQSKKG